MCHTIYSITFECGSVLQNVCGIAIALQHARCASLYKVSLLIWVLFDSIVPPSYSDCPPTRALFCAPTFAICHAIIRVHSIAGYNLCYFDHASACVICRAFIRLHSSAACFYNATVVVLIAFRQVWLVALYIWLWYIGCAPMCSSPCNSFECGLRLFKSYISMDPLSYWSRCL